MNKIEQILRDHRKSLLLFSVIPAQAGIQARRFKKLWMPVFTGMTANLDSYDCE